MKTLFLSLLVLLSAQLLPAYAIDEKSDTTVSTLNVFYESGESELTEASRSSIDKFLRLLDKPLFYQIEVHASTDSVGSMEFNDRLSQNRANGVVNYLSTSGVDVSAVQIVSTGERKIQKRPSANPLWKSRTASITIRQFDPLKKFESSVQRFRINPAKLNVITGNKGTKVIIPANAFRKSNGGAVFGLIEIELCEYYTQADFVLNGLHTSATDQLIESGGTVNLRAKQNGQELVLRPGGSLQLRMPTDSTKTGMEAFFGSEVDSTHALIDWHAESEFGSVEDRSLVVDFGRAEQLLSRESVVRNLKLDPSELEFLEFFGEPGNEEELGILVGNALRKKDVRQLQNLVDRYDLDMIVAGKEFFSDTIIGSFFKNGRNYTGSGIIYRKSTKRTINLEEETFAKFEFEKTDGLKFISNNNEHIIELTEAKMDFSKPFLVQDYYMSVNKLGWINCDRFMGERGMELTILEVEIDPALYETVNLSLVFRDINSVMPGRAFSDGTVRFYNVPVGMKAELFGYVIDSNSLAATQKEIVIGKERLSVDFEETTPEAMKESLAFVN